MTRNPIDRAGERIARRIASYTSRRSFLGRLGTLLIGAPALPLLPVARAQTPPSAKRLGKETDFTLRAQTKDPTICTYWRYCAIDGDLCSCAGGGVHTCPPGSLASPTGWIGTCVNPDDKKSYLIAYHDCCGKNPPSLDHSCECHGTDRELPIYRPQSNNDIVWCFGEPSFAYHCSTALLVGLAD